MGSVVLNHSLKVFTTCPLTAKAERAAGLRHLRDIARWSEDAGCEGILVFTDNAQLDPWLVSQVIIEATERLSPLVAIQPIYLHPYSIAKMITSLAFLHGRRLYLNLVAGGFKNDLAALNDPTPHDERYARLTEYATIVQRLLGSAQPVSFEGRYYKVANLKLTPPLPAELRPGVLMSGSSPAGQQAARELQATAVEYPKPPAECASAPAGEAGPRGIRIGIIGRATEDEAWAVAHGRYPEDRKGQLAQQLATKVSDSVWRRQLSVLAEQSAPQARSVYWLGPFQNYKAVCPFLVGSYAQVADELARYIAGGYRTFILDVPATGEEMRHAGIVFDRAAGERLAA